MRIDDLGLDAFQRLADGANDVLIRRIDERAAGSFGQAVGLQHINAERMKIPANLGIEARASGHQKPHALAEQIVNVGETKFARG